MKFDQKKIQINNQLTINSISGITRVIVSLLILFLITPYMLNRLGTTLYGIWSLGAVFTSYASIGDLGLGNGIVKFTAKFYKEKQFTEINTIVNTTLITYIFVFFSLNVLVWVFSENLLINVLQVPLEYLEISKITVIATTFIFSLNVFFSSFGKVLDGIQKIEINNGIKLLSVIIQSLLIYLFIRLDFGIRGVLLAQFLAVLISGFCSYILTKKFLPELTLNAKYFNIIKLRKTLNYSLQVQVAGLINLGYDPLNRILITRLISIEYLAVYDVAIRIITQLISLINASVMPIFPYSSENIDNPKNILELYKKYLNIYYSYGLFCFILSFFLIENFITIWLGEISSDVTFTIKVLLISWAFGVISIPAYMIFTGIGKPKFNIINQIILIITNTFVAITLIRFLNYRAIVFSMATGLFFAGLYTIIKFLNYFNQKASFFQFKSIIKYLLPSIIISFSVNKFFKYFISLNYFKLMVIAIICICFYLFYLILIKEIDVSNLA